MSPRPALLLIGLSAALPAFPQAGPGVPKKPDAAFFSQDPKALVRLCSDEALRLDPKDAELQVGYGEIQLGLGDRAKAEAAFAAALRGATDDPRVHHWIGKAWLRHGCSKEALASYDAMVNVSLSGRYETRKSLFTNAAVDLVATQPAVAGAYMEKAYLLDVRDADNCLAFGRAALLAGQRDLAATYFAKAVQADPRNEDIWLGITDAFADDQVAHRPKPTPVQP